MWTTFISASAGSLAGSGYTAAAEFYSDEMAGALLNNSLSMIGFSSISGGLSAWASGGSFMDGFYTAAIVATCNHACHMGGGNETPAEESSEGGFSINPYELPVYGACQMSSDAIAQGRYLDAGIWFGFAVAEMFTFGALAEYRIGVQVAAKTGTTVLGHYPEYVKLAKGIGARRFQIPTSVWNKMSATEQWTANTKFLDRMILRGDKIRLATPLNQVKPGSFFQRELNYLFDKGYKVSSDGLWLTK